MSGDILKAGDFFNRASSIFILSAPSLGKLGSLLSVFGSSLLLLLLLLRLFAGISFGTGCELEEGKGFSRSLESASESEISDDDEDEEEEDDELEELELPGLKGCCRTIVELVLGSSSLPPLLLSTGWYRPDCLQNGLQKF